MGRSTSLFRRGVPNEDMLRYEIRERVPRDSSALWNPRRNTPWERWKPHKRQGKPASLFLCSQHLLNLHATFTKGTVEFRLFQFDAPANGRRNGLHAGQLKSYIQLCLALSQMAKTVRTASPKPQQNENPKYAMRTWLLRLGFIGEEFETARDILIRRLSGDAAFRNGRAAA